MPYTVVKDGERWCVYKEDPDGTPIGKTLGCHASEDEANDQLAALYAAEEGKSAPEPEPESKAIAEKEGAPKSPPKGYPADKADYGDPKNYKYPIDAKHIRPAIGYFNQDGQREAGGYSEAEWATIGKRIAARAGKLLDAPYEFRDGKVVRKDEGKSYPVKALREEDGGVVVGGYLLLWGDPKRKDLGDEYFTPKTELWLDVYKSVPALFHHGLDDMIGLSAIGRRLKAEVDDVGVWVEDWLNKSSRFWHLVKPLLEAERLYYSPGSAPHLVKKAADGELLVWPVVEDTLTPMPMQHRLLPIEQLKGVYKTADLPWPDAEEGGAESGDSGLAAAKARAEAVLRMISIEESEGD